MDKKKPILVTGGTGYIASWIIKYLLEDGYSVNTTVRKISDKAKYSHLTDIASKTKGKLTFFEADLMIKDSFLDSMKDVEIVIHTASPFIVTNIKDAQKDLIDPAKQGTINVLNSVNETMSVKRVVLTSSVAAIHGDNIDIQNTENNIFTEAYWNNTSSLENNPYPYSKYLAEVEAWDMQKKQSRWSLTTINPSFVFGPSLSKRTDSTSINTMLQLGNGTFLVGVPELYFGVVDVRDVALAHIKAFEIEAASGRHILCADSIELFVIGQILKKHFPKYLFPIGRVPYFLIWLVAPLIGFTREYVEKNMRVKLVYDNSYTKKDLNFTFRNIEDTFRDHFEQLIEDKLV
jgi:nucleoside-diphosphate-sugar epimerase